MARTDASNGLCRLECRHSPNARGKQHRPQTGLNPVYQMLFRPCEFVRASSSR